MDDLLFLPAVVDGKWRPGIGDPTFVGWLTVVAYLVTAAVCYRAAYRGPTLLGRRRAESATFWLVLASLMLLLGINKQLDLQSFLTVAGRQILEKAGLYQERRNYQVAFIIAVASTCVALFGFFLWIGGRSLRDHWLALVGMGFVLGFVMIRASSFHHVDILLSSRVGGLRWNWIFELGGIGAVGVSAFRACRQRDGHIPDELKNSLRAVYSSKRSTGSWSDSDHGPDR
jgi:hypothetical protein